jgi:hypothetical protein
MMTADTTGGGTYAKPTVATPPACATSLGEVKYEELTTTEVKNL